MSSTKTDALLPVEDWTGRGDSRHQHEQDHQRQPHRQGKQNAGNIETGFPARPPAQRRWREFARRVRSSPPVRARQILFAGNRRGGSESPLKQVKHDPAQKGCRIVVPPDPGSAAPLAESVQFTIGHATALGRLPDFRGGTLYSHFFTAANPPKLPRAIIFRTTRYRRSRPLLVHRSPSFFGKWRAKVRKKFKLANSWGWFVSWIIDLTEGHSRTGNRVENQPSHRIE